MIQTQQDFDPHQAAWMEITSNYGCIRFGEQNILLCAKFIFSVWRLMMIFMKVTEQLLKINIPG